MGFVLFLVLDTYSISDMCVANIFSQPLASGGKREGGREKDIKDCFGYLDEANQDIMEIFLKCSLH